VSLLIVVFTGIIGRSIYGLVQTEGLQEQLKKLAQRLEPMLSAVSNHGDATLDSIVDRVTRPPETKGSLIGMLLIKPFSGLGIRLGLRHARDMFMHGSDYRAFRDTYLEALNARSKLAFQHRLKRLMDGWRVFHVVLSIILLLVMAAHIVVSVK